MNKQDEKPQIWNLSSIEVGNLDFGLVDFDKQKLLKIEILNDGDENILESLSLSSPDFQLAVNTCQSLLVGEKCYVKISFNAKGKLLNTYTGNLVFGSHINVVTAQISRVGEITDSVFINNGLPVVSYDFGTIEYNHLLLKSIFVKNTGTLNQTDSVSMTGSDFSVVYDACSGKLLKPSSQCLVKVLLSGQGKAGLVSSSLNYGSKTLPLSANVKTQAEVAEENSEFVFVYNNQVATGPVDFETINLNSFKEYKVYVKNVGTRAGKVLSSSYSDKLDVFYNGCDNVSLNPNQSCLLRAHLSSPSKGSFSTTLSANVDYQTNSQSVQWIVREPGDTIDCSQNIANSNVAEITWTGTNYTNCELLSCDNTFHKVINSCEPDVISCTDSSGIGTQSWNGSSYDSCLFSSCNSGYYINNNQCLAQICAPNFQTSCPITNGSGIQTCNAEGSLYSSCVVATCDVGSVQVGNTCIPQVITGGTKTSDATYTYHTFSASDTFSITGAPKQVTYFIIGGGGGGASAQHGTQNAGVGGTGGQGITGTTTLSVGNHNVIVGLGGAGTSGGSGGLGGNSSLGSLIANGGAGGVYGTGACCLGAGTAGGAGGSGLSYGGAGGAGGAGGGGGNGGTGGAGSIAGGAGGGGGSGNNLAGASGPGARGIVVIRYPKN